MKSEDVNTPQNRWRARMLVLHGTLLLVPLGLWLFRQDGGTGTLPGFCLWNRCFGFDCPGCGMTRSAGAFLTGRVSDSMVFHPAGPFVVALLFVLTLYLVAVVGTPWRGAAWRLEAKAYSTLDTLMAGSLLFVWIGKLTT